MDEPEPVPVDVHAILGDIVTLANDGHEALGDLTEGTLDDLGSRLIMVQHALNDLAKMKAALEVALIDAMPEATLLTGNYIVKREPVTRWAWKDAKASAKQMREDIAFNVANTLATDLETSEVNIGRRNVILNAIRELFTVIPAIQDMKVDGARRYGLDRFDYKSKTDGYNVTIQERP